MFKTQLREASSELTRLQTTLPIRKIEMNPYLPLVLVQYENGRLAVLRIPDGSVVANWKNSREAINCWSLNGGEVLSSEKDIISIRNVESNSVVEKRVDGKILKLAVNQHLLAVKISSGHIRFIPLNDKFNVDISFGFVDAFDFCSGQDCFFIFSQDEYGIKALKINVVVSGEVNVHEKLQEKIVIMNEEKQKLIKATEQLKESIQKWRDKAFIDFISIHQLTHFFVKYDRNDVKRDGVELQRLEILFRDAVESVIPILEDEDIHKLQETCHSISRMTILLRGADDLELMSARLSDVIEDIKVCTCDFDFIVRLIISKFEIALSDAKSRLDACKVILTLIPSFECRFEGDTIEDYHVYDDQVYLISSTKGTRDGVDGECSSKKYYFYKNNEKQLESSFKNCNRVHISSSNSVLVFFDNSVEIHNLQGGVHNLVFCNCTTSVTGRNGICTLRESIHSFHVVDLAS
jgi:hypothetical protein